MYYVGRQWIILKSIIIKLDYTVSREAISSIYIYIGRSRGRAGI